MTDNKAVFLDFDGVLFDTVKEAYVLCMLASGKSKLPEEISFSSGHYRLFKKYRFLIRHAGDYRPLLGAIDKKLQCRSACVEKKFKSLSGRRVNIHRSFERYFLRIRKHLKHKHYKYWLSLNKPYGFLRGILKLINTKRRSFFIITTKDKDSISRLLRVYGIRLPAANIYSREPYLKFKSKGNIINFVKDRKRLGKCIFVDDSREHIFTCKEIPGLDIIHAKWGYASTGKNYNNAKTVADKIKKLLGD